MAARRKYQWEEWFSRPRTVLVRGIDYHCSQTSMSTATRNAASKIGVGVRLVDTGDKIIINVHKLRRRHAISNTDTTPVAG